MTRYWIGVVSRNHVERGVDGGFAQLCHGKQAPLQRMKMGDWLIYYSPKIDLAGKQACQAFTAIGRLVDDGIYQVEITEDFCPFRREVDYLPCSPADIRPLLDELFFTKDAPNWGWLFRRGHFEIQKADFERIASAMNVDLRFTMDNYDSRIDVI